jgi:hypothetical protein
MRSMSGRNQEIDNMKTYIVFRPGHGQYIVQAETLVRAIQSVLIRADGFARDWIAHDLSTYPQHLQDRLRRESVAIG